MDRRAARPDALPDPLPVPARPGPFDARVRLPGSKSLTNRAAVLAALAHGESTLRHPLRSDDCDRLLDALETLGAGVERRDDHVVIRGVAGRFPRGGSVNLHEGGTPTRFMIAAATLANAPVVVDGAPRMRERPVAEGVDLLRQLGAQIEYPETDGRLPVRIHPQRPRGGPLTVGRTASSQFISAIMLIAPWLDEPTTITFADPPTSRSYLELTAHEMRRWGIDIALDDHHITITAAPVRALKTTVEIDASSIVYPLVAAAVIPGARVTIDDLPVGSVQPDLLCIDVLERMGMQRDGEAFIGPPTLRAVEADLELAPDGALAIAAACARADGVSTLTGLRTLRVKETDRIAALAHELEAIGCRVEASDNALTIDPAGAHDEPVTIRTYHDHRMAMAFASIALARPGISIENPACVAKSFPGFWEMLAGLADAAQPGSREIH